MKTIAQQIKWDFKTNDTLVIRDTNGNPIYLETSNGNWENREYNSRGNLIYVEDSDGVWAKREWDSHGYQIYYENSNGVIEDNRPKPCEDKEIVIDGEKFKLVKV